MKATVPDSIKREVQHNLLE